VIEAIPASNDVNLPGLATTETLTRHVNLNYFSEAVSWEGEERLADADSWRITGNPHVIGSSVGLVSINALLFTYARSPVYLALELDFPPLRDFSLPILIATWSSSEL
jgi:hypothetical protein